MRLWTVCLALLHLVCSVGGVGEDILSPGLWEKIVDAHNTMRRRERATNMELMEWHKELAAKSFNVTEGCVWAQTPKESLTRVVRGFDQLSLNLHAAGVLSDIEGVIERWAEETYNYRYDTGQCNKVCWHYTQLVWATTHAVGCSLRYCPRIQNVVWGKHGGYMLSCLYGPGGNIEGQRPYIHGDIACSNCSHAFPYCVDGLCSRLMIPTTPTTTTPSTTNKPEISQSTLAPLKTTVPVGSATSLRSPLGGLFFVLYIAVCRVL